MGKEDTGRRNPRNVDKTAKDSVNLATHAPSFAANHPMSDNVQDHVIFEDVPENDGFDTKYVHEVPEVGGLDKEPELKTIRFPPNSHLTCTKYNQTSPECDESPICHQAFVAEVYNIRKEFDYLTRRVNQFWNDSLMTRKKPPHIEATVEAIAATSTHPKTADSLFVKDRFQGHAILDTGASRSVIGDDVLPSLIKSLPLNIRQLICEVPSKVGFRFGNNQVTHSFKQVRIPILRPRQRIWLVIEVVPTETPFLLSIQKMKTLGAPIHQHMLFDQTSTIVVFEGKCQWIVSHQHERAVFGTIRMSTRWPFFSEPRSSEASRVSPRP